MIYHLNQTTLERESNKRIYYPKYASNENTELEVTTRMLLGEMRFPCETTTFRAEWDASSRSTFPEVKVEKRRDTSSFAKRK